MNGKNNKIWMATEVFRLITAVLLSFAAGLTVVKGVRETLRDAAEDEGIFELWKDAKAKADKE